MAKKSSQELFRITPVYERLLIGSQKLPYGGIHHLHMLRADQFCWLYYSPKSVKHVQALLKDLVDYNYLQEEWPPTRLLRSKDIYVLGQESKAYLKEKDYHISDTLWSSVEIGSSSSEGEKRRDRMREVVRQELGSELKTLGNYFVFTNQPQPPDPKHMWLDPCWHTPYMEDKPVAVL